jgi:alkylresorcinol/alkylpyrone synthase
MRLTHDRALEFARERVHLSEGTLSMYARMMAGSEIETRAVAVDDLAEALDTDHDRILARFERWAVSLSVESLTRALGAAAVAPDEIGFLAVTTCTGYLCPGLSSYVAERCRLRPDVGRVDIVGMGCGAAVPALEQACQYLAAHPDSSAAVVSTEICSAAMFLGDAIDLIVSNTIFGDGSAAAVLRPAPERSRGDGNGQPSPRLAGFESLLVPEWRDGLRFRTEGGHLRNVLSRQVPARAGEACRKIADGLLARHRLTRGDVDHWVIHAGGKAVLDAVQRALELPADGLATARSVLRRSGNMSSPTVLFVLDEMHRERRPQAGDRAILSSFGAGFAAHAALLEY